MSKILSEEEWLKLDSNFFWVTTDFLFGSKIKSTLIEIVLKYCEKNLKGWFYFSEDYWMFEHKEDVLLLKSIITCGQFENLGEI